MPGGAPLSTNPFVPRDSPAFLVYNSHRSMPKPKKSAILPKPTRPLKTIEVRTAAQRRAWLAEHHDSKPGVWLVFFKRHTGRPSVPYGDAVDEALCFGWIDSAKRPETKARRLEEAIRLLAAGKKLGLK